jgi:hypothetical protein
MGPIYVAHSSLGWISVRALFFLLLCLTPTVARSQVYISPVGNYIKAPNASWTITMSIGVPHSNPIIWVDGVAHPGTSYTIPPDTTKDPKEYLYWGTVTLNLNGQQVQWSSLVNGPARPGDLISTTSHGVTGIEFVSDYPLYQRDWHSNPLHGRDVPTPTVVPGGHNFPACYQRSAAMQLQVSTSGTGANNGVTVEYLVNTNLLDGSDVIWQADHGWTAFTPGVPFTVTTPALPGYIYKHSLFHTYKVAVLFAYDPPMGDRERRVIWAYDTITTPIYAVFSNPVSTFPPYRLHDVATNSLQTPPWYEIMDNAVNHVSIGGTDRTVTAENVAMKNLTHDMHVWPSRPDGPGVAKYNPNSPLFYFYNSPSGTEVRFDLWGMALTKVGDCQDFSAYLECQARTLGIPNVSKINYGPAGHNFETKPVTFCGSSGPAASTNFVFHQLTYWASGGGIYDWSVSFPSPDAYGHPWTLAIGFSQSQEKTWLFKRALNSLLPPVWSATFALGNEDPMYGNLPTWLASYPKGY